MRIVVLIGPGRELDDADARAVEQALRIARRRIGVNVSVLTAGPSRGVQTLRAALALGADDGAHVLDDDLATSDVLALSTVYAAALRRLGFDLVLCAASPDTPNLSAIPAMLAERLALPLLARADSLAVGGPDKEEVIALCDEGCFLVERAVRPPAVVSVTEHAPAPRYPSFPAVVEARRKIISTLTLPKLGIDPAGVRHSAAATVVSSSVTRSRARIIVDAGENPRAAAGRLADFLAAQQFIEN